jgi:hypothetical protein
MKSRRLLSLISTVAPVAKAINMICNPGGLKKVQIHFAMDVTMDIGL